LDDIVDGFKDHLNPSISLMSSGVGDFYLYIKQDELADAILQKRPKILSNHCRENK